jgi:hypothetical protein
MRLGPYLELLASFLSGSIGVSDFEVAYLDLFKRDNVIRPEPVLSATGCAQSPYGASAATGCGQAHDRCR